MRPGTDNPVAPGSRSALEERFEIRGKLGAGGTGVVYRAVDRQRGSEVALKMLRQVTGRDLYRFKREFRGLADVLHPNLVVLHELYTVGSEWFISMELVDGVSFIDWVRPSAVAAGTPIPATGPTAMASPNVPQSLHLDSFGVTGPTSVGASPLAWGSRQRIIEAPLDHERLQAALYQLVDTVHALHLAGKLHRDLKPSNVLVDGRGRVVIMDFGLTSDVAGAAEDHTHETRLGTPAYMSPEQAADGVLGPASDWYSVGIMLYEALTGRRPIDLVSGRRPGGATPVTVPRPSHFQTDVPAHLEALCLSLLQPEPEHRPLGAEILARLGHGPSLASQEFATQLAPPTFVGRQTELAALRRALADSRVGACVPVIVRGLSGMGKTALLRHFLDEIAQAPDAIVLKGRCYERESLPFKTLDTIIDSLTSILLQLPEARLAEVLPRDITVLSRLFPVLLRVPAIAEPAVRGFEPPDPLELRRRGFGALRVLLSRLAHDQPVIVAIDDVQWGDADSGTFLADLLHHPEPPAALVLLGQRAEDERTSPLLGALRRSRAALGEPLSPLVMREIDVGPFGDDDARALIRALGSSAAGDDATGALVRDAGGSPMFLAELARAPGAEAGGRSTLDQLLGRRIGRVSTPARALMEVCAVAARPLRVEQALAAAGLAGADTTITELRSERMVRVRRNERGVLTIETAHDRIRAAAVLALGEAGVARVHGALARTLIAADRPDHEALVEHWRGAGDLGRAAHHAELAAVAAETRLAFHRAADLYLFASENGGHTGAKRLALLVSSAHALTNAGRLDEAVSVFAAAAAAAAPAERLELRRLELEQLLRRGRLSEGLIKGRAVLAAVGQRLPRTRIGAIASLVAQRSLVRLRGLEFKERAAAELPASALARIDVLYSVSSGMSFVSPLLGKVLQMRHLRESLAEGEPRHVCKALTLELGYLGMQGTRARARLDALLERTLTLARRLGDDNLVGAAMASGALSSFLYGDWRLAWSRFIEAERFMRERCDRVRWELDLTEVFMAAIAWWRGHGRELARLVPLYLREAEERGDVYAQRGLRGWRANTVWLVIGRPDEARAHVQAVSLPRGGAEHPTHFMHYYELLANTQIDLYQGDAWSAHDRVEGMWRDLGRAMILRMQSVCIEGWSLRGRAALAAAATGSGNRRRLIALGSEAARRISATGAAWSEGLVAILRASAAHLDGDDPQAILELERAAAACDRDDMGFFAAAARLRLGQIVGGTEGAALVARSEAHMREQAVVDPHALCAVLAPGFRGAGGAGA
jgi:serine/threonine protein kinase